MTQDEKNDGRAGAAPRSDAEPFVAGMTWLRAAIIARMEILRSSRKRMEFSFTRSGIRNNGL
jgi:hypothetical protein